MIIKIDRDVRLTHDQLNELPTVLAKPDMGWDFDNHYNELPHVYDVEFEGEHGTYTYRVNQSWKMITVLGVE